MTTRKHFERNAQSRRRVALANLEKRSDRIVPKLNDHNRKEVKAAQEYNDRKQREINTLRYRLGVNTQS